MFVLMFECVCVSERETEMDYCRITLRGIEKHMDSPLENSPVAPAAISVALLREQQRKQFSAYLEIGINQNIKRDQCLVLPNLDSDYFSSSK